MQRLMSFRRRLALPAMIICAVATGVLWALGNPIAIILAACAYGLAIFGEV